MDVYSFSDVVMTIKHPLVGQFVATGQGVGSIGVNMTADRTVHDAAADGNIMVSKIKIRNGMLVISSQQISELNKWLKKWFNYLEAASSDQWAATSIVVRSLTMAELITATGVSPQKQADKPFQVQGQQIVWNLMAADIQQD